jgi:hypothetical protein
MSVAVLAFGFGVLLLFVALVGGGFELRELKVPKVGWMPRSAAAVLGIVFIMLGVGMLAGDQAEPVAASRPQPPAEAPSQPVDPPPTRSPITFTVADRLGDLQVTEQVLVTIDGRQEGALTVDVANPESTLTVTMAEPGTYTYELRSRTTFDLDGDYTEVEGYGRGKITVEQGSSLAIAYEPNVEAGRLDLSLQNPEDVGTA